MSAYLEDKPGKEVRNDGGDTYGDETGHHEGMVEQILAYLRCAGAVEIDGRYIRRIVRDKEIAIDGWQHAE